MHNGDNTFREDNTHLEEINKVSVSVFSVEKSECFVGLGGGDKWRIKVKITVSVEGDHSK